MILQVIIRPILIILFETICVFPDFQLLVWWLIFRYTSYTESPKWPIAAQVLIDLLECGSVFNRVLS